MASGQVSLAIFWGMKLMSGRHSNRKPREVGCWLSTFLRELVSMPKRHIGVFLIATALLVLLEVELTEGWHLLPILEVPGGMLFLYLVWTAWWSSRQQV